MPAPFFISSESRKDVSAGGLPGGRSLCLCRGFASDRLGAAYADFDLDS
jgi:hypothetical protein